MRTLGLVAEAVGGGSPLGFSDKPAVNPVAPALNRPAF